MRRLTAATLAAATLAVTALLTTAALAQKVSPAISAAVADAGRPAADTARDADRHPAESVAFSGMKPGDKVADFLPGGGYYTRIFSKVVGPKGHVYAVLPAEFAGPRPRAQAEISAVLPAYSGNTELLVKPYSEFGAPEKLDVVWTSLNYHDLHNPGFAVPDIAAFNKAVFNALKPGGVFMVIDYAAPGAGFSNTGKLHRVDEEAVKKEVEAAGFVLDGESPILHRATDDHTLPSGSDTMKDKADEFMLRFKRPA